MKRIGRLGISEYDSSWYGIDEFDKCYDMPWMAVTARV